MRQPIIRHSYVALLLTLLLLMITAPLTHIIQRWLPNLDGAASITPQTLIVTVVSGWTAWRNIHFRFVPTMIAAAIVIGLGVTAIVFGESFTVVHIIAQTAFLGFIVGAIVRDIFSSLEVDGNILCGSICVYLLIGVLGGLIFALIELVHPGSFWIDPNVAPHNLEGAETDPGFMMYFSFVVLTTVGFGDILPASEAARSASVLIAVAGQLTLVILISRLVGLHIAGSPKAK
jgi:hypothetical protein